MKLEPKKKSVQISNFSNSDFLVEMKLVHWHLGSPVTPRVSPEHCAPPLLDTQAGSGDCRPATTAEPLVPDLALISPRLPHTRSSGRGRLCPSGVQGQLLYSNWQRRDEKDALSQTG